MTTISDERLARLIKVSGKYDQFTEFEFPEIVSTLRELQERRAALAASKAPGEVALDAEWTRTTAWLHESGPVIVLNDEMGVFTVYNCPRFGLPDCDSLDIAMRAVRRALEPAR